jgi:hypothetical protein
MNLKLAPKMDPLPYILSVFEITKVPKIHSPSLEIPSFFY